MEAPKAKRVAHPHRLHDDVRQDDYYWLRDRENPEVIQHLEAENAYYEAHVAPLRPMADRLYQDMIERIPEAETKVPVQSGDYYYYSRMEKSLQYPLYCRKSAANREQLAEASEEVLLDLNALAVDGGYLSITEQRMDPNHRLLAYLENRDGTDRYTIFVKDVATGQLRADRIANVFIGDSLEWDASGQYLFYVTVDDSQRPYRAWRHRLGDTGADDLLYEESDTTYTLSLSKSRSGRFIFFRSENKTTTEVRYLAADQPLGEVRVLDPRRQGIEYSMEDWGDDFLILTNEAALNFRVMRCPIDNPAPAARTELFPYDDNRYLQAVFPFRDGVVLAGRQNGLTELWLYRNGALTQAKWDEPLYTVSFGDNRSYDTHEALIHFESLITPKSTYALDLRDGTKTLLQRAPISGNYDADAYKQERLWATADDGMSVPMVIVSRKGVLDNGPAPLILYGYGSYGANSDPRFDPMKIPFLDRGIVFVTAQVRGGSEMGRAWYENGKLLYKRNTFTDFIAAAKDLIARGYTTADKLAGRGRSAGGLLIGGVSNLGGQLFKVLVADVPFVDVVTTMLDATIPLTTLEWDEWGNPAEPDYYTYMKSYSPYDNVEAKAYPHMLVTCGLNDPRVAYWEPAKWVARLRTTKTDGNMLLLKTNMGAGHFGASGRFNHVKEAAETYAILLDKLDVQVN